MLTEQQSLMVEFGVALQELADRYQSDAETLTTFPLEQWHNHLLELLTDWTAVLKQQDLMLKTPDRDKESIKRMIDHASSLIDSQDTKKSLTEYLTDQTQLLKNQTDALLQENPPAEAVSTLKACQSLCEEIDQQLTNSLAN